ncbi:MAG: polysaccharide biosynthesis protein [Clostridiales bacterium]|nr:polysaccharide biosynthesis protein [Clostridiales bacterium]
MSGENEVMSVTGRFKETVLYIVLDAVIVNLSLLTALTLWYGGSIPGGGYITFNTDVWHWYFCAAPFVSLVNLIVYALFGVYRKIWKYADIEELIKIFISQVIISALIIIFDAVYISRLGFIEMSHRMIAVFLVVNTVLFVFSRSGVRFIKRMFISLENRFVKKAGIKRVMIIGAGYGGYNAVRSIIQSAKGYENRMAVIIVDDDMAKNNTTIHGVRVTNDIDNVPVLAEEYKIDEIIIAVPSADNIQLKRIMENCTKTNCSLKLVPPMSDVSEGGSFNRVLQEVKITDLLFRDEIKINVDDVSGSLKGKTVLVTGGGGSIGSELCRQIAKFIPKKLIIFDIYENNAYELYSELKDKYGSDIDIAVIIGSVCDKAIVKNVFEVYRPQVIFHAAAHKHVPLMEFVPKEAVKNNVFGTLNIAQAADRFSVERFVLLSTDKAVNPANVMGATKRITEMIIQQIALRSKTKFMAVRFGNVLGSNGSVIQIFKKQIAEGGPLRVTHKDITRFFMTIPEAARLVLQAGGMGSSGSIYVLDMGEQVKINDLAVNLIKLSGYKPYEDIDIVYTGLRPGEKLCEELITEEEKKRIEKTKYKEILAVKPGEIDSEKFMGLLKKLYRSCGDDSDTVAVIREIVPNFKTIVSGAGKETVY